uniref:RRM domain-containing protein n=1 Tax=Aureoumbra lagunensis TaxID=44058 RepID=A0A7S3K5T4_9STRA|mmetsp:Transcript_8714/g.12084  ORF Transcript_8714/g.12084 Transcript_8714/m.12084 type:complete len:604 (+) Transcript_8714:34-1845(+)
MIQSSLRRVSSNRLHVILRERRRKSSLNKEWIESEFDNRLRRQAEQIFLIMCRGRDKKGLIGTLNVLKDFASGDKRFQKKSLIKKTEHFMKPIWSILNDRFEDFLTNEIPRFCDDDDVLCDSDPRKNDELIELTTLFACAVPSLCGGNIKECISRNEIKKVITPLIVLDAHGKLIIDKTNENMQIAAEFIHMSTNTLAEKLESAHALADIVLKACPEQIQNKIKSNLDPATKKSNCNCQICTPLIHTLIKHMNLHAAIMNLGKRTLDLWEETVLVCASCEKKRQSSLNKAKIKLQQYEEEFYQVKHSAQNCLFRLREDILQMQKRLEEIRSLSIDLHHFKEDDLSKDQLLLPSSFDKTYIGIKKRSSTDSLGSLANVSILLSSPLPIIPDIDTSREIFINNLPSQITSTQLETYVSSLGQVETIQFMHDISSENDDNTAAELSSNKPKSKYTFRNTPITPFSKASAFVRFTTSDAALAALKPSLRIFGFVIDKHQCRTQPASELISFFLYNLRPDIHEDTLAFEIAQLLQIDAEKNICIWRKDPYERPSRARLRFPCHAHARWAWHKFSSHLHSSASIKNKDDDDPPFEISWSPLPGMRISSF